MAKHTPTPWEVTEPMEDYHEFDTPFGYRRENGDWSTVGWVRCAGRESTSANAEFIVLACNSHNALLEACRNAQRALLRILPQDEMLSIYAEIESAIRLAEGKENASE